MLGLCWTPAAVQSMKKLANTVPSNPEQLLGAILVRKDIFHRFETTMNDTCLDANNLLEYLFSLYNSTASPSERDNFPSPQDLGFMRRDLNHNKKAVSRVQQAFHYQNNAAVSQLPLPAVHKKPDRGHNQSAATNGHRKKIKTEQPIIPEEVNFLAENQDYYSQSLVLKQYDSQPVFPGSIRDTALSMKMELTPKGESPHAETTPLPVLSQSQQPNSRQYSPSSVEFSSTLSVSPHEDNHILGADVRADPSSDVKIEVEGTLQGVLETPKKIKGTKRSTKSTKRSRLKGFGESGESNGGDNIEYEGRKKRHPCFCGAMFTRADNLKRHIRKCHEEKLEKLNSTLLDFDTDNSSAQAMDFSQSLDVSDQAGVEDPPQAQDSQDCQKVQEEQQPDQQQKDPQQMKEPLQQMKEPLQHNVAMEMPALEMPSRDGQWTCFCGETFEHHHQLTEHTHKTHGDT